jgi:predicted HicB family RNase H-like nuclease
MLDPSHSMIRHLSLWEEFPMCITIAFQGKSVESTKQSFKDAVNEYLEWCKKYDKIPEKPLKLDLP